MAGKTGITVRGSCPDGHITEAITTGNRLTWRGKCSNESCPHTVTARRIPRDQVPPEPAPAAAGNSESEQYPFIEVQTYGQLPDHAPGDGLVVEPDFASHAGPSTDDGEPGAAATAREEREQDPVVDDPKRGVRERLRARPRGQWNHPLL